MIRVETADSVWLFDEGRLVYMRMPRTECPRSWIGPRRETLTDLVWHPYERWLIVANPCKPRLVIHISDTPYLAVTAPLAVAR